jgi:hypothetical protein
VQRTTEDEKAMPIGSSGGGRLPRALRHARLATATLFFANGCGLGSWLPHIPDVKLWHGLSDGVLGLALLAIAGGAVAALPVAGALTGMGLGLAKVVPIVFSAAGRLPGLAPGIGIAAVSTAGYFGFLAGPPLIGLVAEARGLPVGLGLVALAVGLMVLGAGALERQNERAVVLAG